MNTHTKCVRNLKKWQRRNSKNVDRCAHISNFFIDFFKMSSSYAQQFAALRSGHVSSGPASSAVSDRAAYVAFLETQLERVSARENSFDELQARAATCERACAALATAISSAQEYAERQGAEAGAAVSSLRAAVRASESVAAKASERAAVAEARAAAAESRSGAAEAAAPAAVAAAAATAAAAERAADGACAAEASALRAVELANEARDGVIAAAARAETAATAAAAAATAAHAALDAALRSIGRSDATESAGALLPPLPSDLTLSGVNSASALASLLLQHVSEASRRAAAAQAAADAAAADVRQLATQVYARMDAISDVQQARWAGVEHRLERLQAFEADAAAVRAALAHIEARDEHAAAVGSELDAAGAFAAAAALHKAAVVMPLRDVGAAKLAHSAVSTAASSAASSPTRERRTAQVRPPAPPLPAWYSRKDG